MARREGLIRALGKLVTLGPSGWLLLLRVQIALWRARRIVRRRPQGQLYDELARRAGPDRPADPAHRHRVHELGMALDRVARMGLGRPLCLVRSLAYQSLLEVEGIPGSRIAVGVRRRNGRFEAHAWVEWNGTVVGEDPDYVAGFVPLSDRESSRDDPLPHGLR